ncbi:MAG: S8 family serine peptidase [Pseudomonadota bacterium]
MISAERISEIHTAIARRAPTVAESDALAALPDEEAVIDAVLADAGADTVRVVRFYQVYFNRLPDDGGLTFWTTVAQAQPPLDDRGLAEAFFGAGEYTALYGSLSDAEAVRALYENVLGREADEPGFNFWLGLVEDPTNGFGIDDLGRQFATADETVASFTPLTEAYLEGLAIGEAARTTLFDYAADVAKALPELTFGAADAAPELLKVSIPEEELASTDGRVSAVNTSNPPDGGRAAEVMSLDDFRADERFEGIDGSGITIAVIDSGIDFDHPAFGPVDGDGTGAKIIFTRDFRAQLTDAERAFSGQDGNGHGTHVAAIAAGLPYDAGDGAPPISGVAPGAEIVSLRVTDDNGFYESSSLERALRWVVDNAATYDIDVVNMSLGGGAYIEPPVEYLADELAALRLAGVIVIAAAGNSYQELDQLATESAQPAFREAIGYPAADPNVIAVGALYEDAYAPGTEPDFGKGLPAFSSQVGDIALFSQRSTIEGLETIFAPGAQILSALPDDTVGNYPGTSMAAPQIAGIAALAQQLAQRDLQRSLTPAEFEDLLRDSADLLRDQEIPRDQVTNTGQQFGAVNVQALGEAILDLRPVDQPPAPVGDTVAGNRSTTATIAPGQTITGTVDTANDADWYAIELTAGLRYSFGLRGQSSAVGTLPDPLVRIFDDNGVFRAANDDGGPGRLESLLVFEPTTSGTYYVVARGYRDSQGTFELSARSIAAVDDVLGSVATAASIAVAAPGSGDIEVGGDLDWYRLEVTAGLTYTVTLAGADGAGGTLADPVLRLVDANGDLIVGNNDGGSRDASVVYTATADDIVYVEAGAAEGADTGTYSISVVAEEFEDVADDESSTATLADGETAASAIDTPFDSDWFGADLLAGRSYTISVAGESTRPGALTLDDPLVSVIDPDGFEVAFADDSEASPDPTLTFVAPIDGRYAFAVEGFFADSLGTYEISLDVAETADIAGDTSTTASIEPFEQVTGALEVVGDWDWFAIELFEGEVWDIGLFGSELGFGTLEDPYLRIYDADGAELVDDDDGAAEFDFGLFDAGLTFDVAESGLYYVEAGSYFDEGEGTYTLAVGDDLFVA